MLTEIRPALMVLLLLTLLTGIAYPYAVTGVAQAVLPDKASGSLVARNGKTVGSALIGQCWDDPKWFWGRPSATTPACNAASSSGSNLGPSNPALRTRSAVPRTSASSVELVGGAVGDAEGGGARVGGDCGRPHWMPNWSKPRSSMVICAIDIGLAHPGQMPRSACCPSSPCLRPSITIDGRSHLQRTLTTIAHPRTSNGCPT